MMEIRIATPQDVASLCSLERECFSSPWSAQAFSESMGEDGAIFFVCDADGETVGYAGGLCVLDECSVTNVAVTASYRRKGVATALLDALEREAGARGVRSVFLEVRVSNLPAIAAYEGRGYVRVGQRRGFYRMPTEDAYIYKKQL